MMMKKSLPVMEGRLTSKAGRPGRPGVQNKPVNIPLMGRPGVPDKMFRGDSSLSTPFSTMKPQPQQQTFARNPSGTQFNQSSPQTMQFNQSPPPAMMQQSGMYGTGSSPGPVNFDPSMIQNKPGMMKKGGKVKPKNMMDGNMAYSKGGSASSRADGCATKGKTKGKMV